MKKSIIFIEILIVSLITILLIGPAQSNYLKIVPEYTHSHTKAICNEQNLCQDYEIFCKNQEIVSISPITGAAIQFPKNWEDPRDEEMREKLC